MGIRMFLRIGPFDLGQIVVTDVKGPADPGNEGQNPDADNDDSAFFVSRLKGRLHREADGAVALKSEGRHCQNGDKGETFAGNDDGVAADFTQNPILPHHSDATRETLEGTQLV